MPTYDYKCKSCGNQYDKFQSIVSETRDICPICGKEAERIISAGTGLIFKGSGFYTTDYKNKSPSTPPTSNCSTCPGAGSTCGKAPY